MYIQVEHNLIMYNHTVDYAFIKENNILCKIIANCSPKNQIFKMSRADFR